MRLLLLHAPLAACAREFVRDVQDEKMSDVIHSHKGLAFVSHMRAKNFDEDSESSAVLKAWGECCRVSEALFSVF
jgi:hypothetical protein